VTVIYLPVVSPDLYRDNDLISYNHGVDFSNGIANSPKVKHIDVQYEESELPTYTSTNKTYTVNTSTTPKSSTGKADYAVTKQTHNQIFSTRSSYVSSNQEVFSIINSQKVAQSKPTLQSNGITTLSSDLTLTDNTTSREKATTDDPSLTDPGGEPTGNPIPVGDGFWILLLLAGVYALYVSVFKYRQNRKESKHTSINL